MKKIVIIPISVIAFIGIAAVAAGILFPDSSPFTRMPIGPWTLGQVLTGAFDANGNALNANMLSWVSASDYLKNKDCSGEPIDKVWVAVDGSGKWRCGHLGGVLADLSIGSISEFYGTVNVYRSGSATSIPGAVGMPLYEGDIVDTAADGTGTIMFAADNSLLRLSTSTNVELRYWELDGNTVAEVILSDGRLWGRILTGTGINLGGGGMVTWVRGTSVDLQKIAGKYVINVINSTSTENIVKPIAKSTSLAGNKVKAASALAVSAILTNEEWDVLPQPKFSAQSKMEYTDASVNVDIVPQGVATSYMDEWIKNNTEADIAYMSSTLSGWLLTLERKNILEAELGTTVGITNIPLLSIFLSGGVLSPGQLTSAATLLIAENAIDASESTLSDIYKKVARRMECKKNDKTYIKDLDQCKGSSYKTLAVSNFQPGDYNTNLNIFWSKEKYNYTAMGWSNRSASPSNKIRYAWASFPELTGKIIKITLSGTTSSNELYVADFWTSVGRVEYKTTGYAATGNWEVYQGATYISHTSNSITFKLDPVGIPNIFLIWNKDGFSKNIWRTIESIEIFEE